MPPEEHQCIKAASGRRCPRSWRRDSGYRLSGREMWLPGPRPERGAVRASALGIDPGFTTLGEGQHFIGNRIGALHPRRAGRHSRNGQANNVRTLAQQG